MRRTAVAEVITVAVVDDDRMLLDGMRSWLANVPGVRLLATTATADELLAEANSSANAAADVVLLDLVLRDGSAPAENIRRLRAGGSRVLVISTVPDRARILAALAAGADGYLTKDNDLATLVAAIEEVAAGGTALSPELAFACAHDESPSRPRLSPRELRILLDYASGMTLKSAARRAGITPNTAKDYLDRVKAKYQQANRPTYTKTDLAMRVREDGLGALDAP
ncbi:two-component system nitrate/nitrite response regulator NarL [Kitasatospora sp. MAP12-15]|uniref:response regulator transcription factor n=1 Tax=unclassified Kitasatospora TaxID=2633591 RepID=UPI00247639DE|nr:response regulator transcription factor [Kitasatospora sp. MAP12-44]MDH6115285.1 two-component system nitrate/nitrite response regulator NarL [Kitasatospora sp. MAP12-44]